MSRSIRISSVALLLVLAAVAGGAVTAGAQTSGDVVGSPELDAFVSANEFDPGTETRLRITLSNDGYLQRGGPAQYEERVTTARGVTVDVKDGDVPVDVTGGPFAVGRVPRGTVSVDPIEMTVSEDAAPGTYRLPVEIEYAYTGFVEYGANSVEYNDYDRERTRYVTVRVRDQSRFEVVDAETSAQIGDTSGLSVTVENVGTEPATDASLVLSSPSDELSFGSGSRESTGFVGAWAPGERKTLEYTLAVRDDAARRGYTLRATVDYEDVDGIARASEPLTVGVRPSAEQSFSLRRVESSLRVGEEGDLVGRVVNEGPGTARSAVVRFSPELRNVEAETTEYALGDLAPGEAARFRFDVTVTDAASPSAQQLNLSVRYRNARGDSRLSDGLEQTVQVAPARDRFAVAAVDRTVTAGSTTALRLRVTNNGDDPLRNVEAKAFVQDPLSSDDDEGLVPRLAPGATDTVVVGLSVSDAALAKTYPVSLDFQYELPDGDTAVSQTYTVPVDVEREPDGGGSSLPLGLAGLAALLAVGGVVVWRRRQ